mgnify:CR=1 FL=1
MAADRLREEAEKLVAVAMTVLSSATRNLGGSGSAFATGSAECCVCPVCRVIAAMREPNSDLTERLAGSVGDLVTGATAVMRLLSGWSGRSPEPEERTTSEGDEYWENLRRKAAEAAKAHGRAASAGAAGRTTADEDPWRVATRADAESSGDADASLAGESPVAAETVAAGTADVSEAAVPRVPRPAPAEADVRATTARRTAPEATGAPTTAGAPTAPVAKKAVAKKAVAKKAVAKKATKPVARREPEAEATAGAARTTGTARTSAPRATAAARATGARKAVTRTVRPGGAA